MKYTDGLEWADVPVEFEDGTKGINRVVLTREDESASDENKEGILVVDPKDPKRVLNRYPVPEGALLAVKEGDLVTKGDNERRATILYTWDPYNDPSIIKADGELRWKDLVPGVTLREELDEGTGLRSLVVMADRTASSIRACWSTSRNRKDPQEYTLAEGSRVILGSPTDQVSRAMEIPDAANPWSTKFHVDERPINEAWPSKTKKESEGQDGLPQPAGQGDEGHHGHQDPAAGVQDPRHHGRSAARRGAVRGAAAEGSGDDLRDRRRGEVRRDQARQARDLRLPRDPSGQSRRRREPQLYEVPAGKHLRVHEGDRVRAGDRLTEGPVNPHDILLHQGPARGAGVPAQRGAGGLPPAGREDQRQAHRRDRAPDAAEGAGHRSGRHRLPRGRDVDKLDLPRRERAGR